MINKERFVPKTNISHGFCTKIFRRVLCSWLDQIKNSLYVQVPDNELIGGPEERYKKIIPSSRLERLTSSYLLSTSDALYQLS